MWRKGGPVVVKLLCLWVVFGAYRFWKYTTNDEEGFQTAKRPSFVHGNNRRESADQVFKNDRELSNYQPVQWDVMKGWQPDRTVHSRHLLAALPNCTPRAVDQFPWDGLTKEERREGWWVLHVLLAFYMFMALAIVCDRYFVPSLEVLCELLHLQTDVAGATFMAAGSSAPELATAVIGVFIAKADVGLSTVVGSAIYNVMFVISMSALFATSVVKLHWWPLFRDCIAYLFSVLALILVIYDAEIQWYESIVLIVMYLLYVGFMFFNERLENWCVPRIRDLSLCTRAKGNTEEKGDYQNLDDPAAPSEEKGTAQEESHLAETLDHAHQEAETWHKLCERPEGAGWTVLWALAMPLSLLLFVTVPDCRRPSFRRLFPLTFLLSLFWLSAFCFLMVWMITVVGYTWDVPDSVMSLTFIAFGVSLPDVVASVLVVRDGLGDMAMSNAIGSNVFDILVCLGLPWFLETCVKDPGSSIPVYSEGLLHSSVLLLSTVAFLLLATHLNGWRLTMRYGLVLLVVYVIYTILAALYELNIFGYFHPPECFSTY
ncbi:sodium/potassium/calcium exchanger 5-like [Babylonia areolata]|uniref:sodium/potassium/calcium exchanger 5-like n=1 Tax=Babylonia areolata TaxID=304850 RepID=UPI003FD608FF